MKEVLLHHIWSSGLLKSKNLRTIQGDSLRIISAGELNNNAGPDFSNASIEINGLRWIGNVEIHVRSSNWNDHNHSTDPAYENIILHVVFESNVDLEEEYPTLELCKYYSLDEIVNIGSESMEQEKRKELTDLLLKSTHITSQKIRELALNRLERKSDQAMNFLYEVKNDWSYLFFIMLCRNMGFQVNSLAFELLARSLPIMTLRHHNENLLNIESLLFGQASLIPLESESSYVNRLKMQHRIYAIKHRLRPINKSAWKFSKTRPSNFPTIRMAQLASFIYHHDDILYNPVEFSKNGHLNIISKCCPSYYWKSHYDFNKTTKVKISNMGRNAVENLSINTVIPFLYLYEKHHGIKTYAQSALSRLGSLTFEENSITKQWRDQGVEGSTALESQALIELKVKVEM